jgi:hypothetical protein
VQQWFETQQWYEKRQWFDGRRWLVKAPLARLTNLDLGRPRLARRARVSNPEVSCSEVAVALPSILDGGAAADEAVVEHVGRCLRCQSELAKYHKLLRLLNQLRGARVEPPPGAVTDVLDAIEDAAQRRVIRSALSGRRLVYAGALAVPVAAILAVTVARRGRLRSVEPVVLS